jgi:hypothetical protein
MHTKFGRKPAGKTLLEDLAVDRIMDIMEIEWEDVDWIHFAQEQWRALVNTVMNLRVL